jgi:hypothetical protein
MSRGDLQEMEVGTKQSKSAVNANAKPADPMQRLTTGIPDGQSGSWEDLGGPDPENYRPDDDSAKLKTPGETLKQVKDVVNKGAKPADSMKGLHKEEEEVENDNFIEEENLEVNESEMELEEVQESSEEETVAELSEEDNEEDNEEGDEEVVEEQYDIEEDVNALLEGEELSEEFQEKARIIFESALNSKVSQIKEDLEEKYSQALIEEVQEIKIHLSERVDAYLEYVSSEWFTENKLVLENGLKTEMTESFLTGMRSLFEEHYVSIPEDKYDVLESMVEKLDEMETKLNEQIERNITLNKRLAESVTDVIFGEVCEGLALSQKDKLASLAENVEFDSEEEYREKLVALKESYFPTNAGTHRNTQDYLVEETTEYTTNSVPSGTMEVYLNALERVSKK